MKRAGQNLAPAYGRKCPCGIRPPSVEGRGSWFAAAITLAILSISYGSPLLIVVGLKTIQQDLGTDRSVIALAGSLVWVGTGLGGIPMGWLADRIGIRAVVAIGAVAIAAGLAISAIGGTVPLYLGHGLLIGLIGNGAIYAPLLIYVSRWFDRRRGAAIALISSGQYIAGVFWPSVFERGIAFVQAGKCRCFHTAVSFSSAFCRC